MNILHKIVETKKQEVAFNKKQIPENILKGYTDYNKKCNSLKSALLDPDSSGIIAEFKQKSPSKGIINATAEVGEVTKSYTHAGAAGLSVLTDFEYFGGSLNNLEMARKANPDTPILRKDFIIDSYQILEAKAHGADVILLIAACLEVQQAHVLSNFAKNLGMEVLMEVHHADELKLVNNLVDMVGVNNRNLKTFQVDVETSVQLSSLIPDSFVKISESGLAGPETITRLKKCGYKGFLIGETFMKTSNPGLTCKQFISSL